MISHGVPYHIKKIFFHAHAQLKIHAQNFHAQIFHAHKLLQDFMVEKISFMILAKQTRPNHSYYLYQLLNGLEQLTMACSFVGKRDHL